MAQIRAYRCLAARLWLLAQGECNRSFKIDTGGKMSTNGSKGWNPTLELIQTQ